MRVIVATDSRFARTPDGTVWSSSILAYSFWRRYLEVFDGVLVIARTEQVKNVPDSWKRLDGPGVDIVPIPLFIGPWQYLLRARAVKRAIISAMVPGIAIVLRIPSIVGSIAGAE